MEKVTYTRNGKEYTKIGRRDTIQVGFMESFDGGELTPVTDGWSFEERPESFPLNQDFYAPLKG